MELADGEDEADVTFDEEAVVEPPTEPPDKSMLLLAYSLNLYTCLSLGSCLIRSSFTFARSENSCLSFSLFMTFDEEAVIEVVVVVMVALGVSMMVEVVTSSLTLR